VIHYLPTLRSQQAGFEALAALHSAATHLFLDKLELDLSRCAFLDANMAAPLAAVLARVTDSLNTVEIVNVPPSIERILRKNGFLVNYGYAPLEDRNRTTIPFRRIQLSEEGLFEDYLQRHLKGKGIPSMSQGLGKYFKQSIFEVFQNAVVHSNSRLGVFVCGQFFPQKQRLDLTISDAGVGIPSTVRGFLRRSISADAAICWALQKGNTTKTGGQPGGVGLKFLMEFIIHNEGKVQIASSEGFYESSGGQEVARRISSGFPGTAVNLEINTSDSKSYMLSSEISPESIF